jgi:aminocarboxymuconate-semialdehyde decarboxylase
MTRLIFGDVFEKYPSVKIITHHAGGMAPYYEERMGAYDLMEMRQPGFVSHGLSKSPIEYYRMFYNDAAVSGSCPALMCAYNFFGPEHLLFGIDPPFDTEQGFRLIRQPLETIEKMRIPGTDKKKIFEDNARQLLRLPVKKATRQGKLWGSRKRPLRLFMPYFQSAKIIRIVKNPRPSRISLGGGGRGFFSH